MTTGALPKRSNPTRGLLRRASWAAARLRVGQLLTASALGREFEVSLRTAYRDFDFLRDEWRVPVEYDPTRRTYSDVLSALRQRRAALNRYRSLNNRHRSSGGRRRAGFRARASATGVETGWVVIRVDQAMAVTRFTTSGALPS